MQYDGVIVLAKPRGYTSNACLQQIKRQCFQNKIGHAGTLDPMVDGVLIVLLGQATKIAPYLMEYGQKTYKGTLCIGYETTTWDSEGEIVERYTTDAINADMVAQAIFEWNMITEQEVPPISAAKFRGKALYKWTRMGYDTPRKFKNVRIDSVELLSIELPYATFRVTCSSGTYIRSLAHSLGQRLQCGAVLHRLTREYSYPFSIEESVSLDTLLEQSETLSSYVKPIVEALPHFSSLIVTDAQAHDICLGRPLHVEEDIEDTMRAVALYKGNALALVQYDAHMRAWKSMRGLFTI